VSENAFDVDTMNDATAEQRWWLCPNTPRCGHAGVLHGIDDRDDPLPRCCVDGCQCGATVTAADGTPA